MKIIVKKEMAEGLIEALTGQPEMDVFVSHIKEKMKAYRADDYQVDISLLTEKGVDIFEQICKEQGNRSLTNQIGTYRRVLQNPGQAKITRLQQLEGALIEWVLEGVIKGWLFQRDRNGELFPWTINSIIYNTSSMREEPTVEIKLSANSVKIRGKDSAKLGGETRIVFHSSQLPATVEQLMSGHYLHETEDLHAEYMENVRRYNEIYDQPNKQFRLAPGKYKKPGSYRNEDYIIGTTHRCINDETLVERTVRDAANRNFWDDVISENPRKSQRVTKGPRQIPDNAFIEMPIHTQHYVFDLETHEHVWVPPSALTEYVYQPEKVDLLVLPEEHRDLIEILTQDADVLIEDVVEGKSGGTTILLEGEPGLGKTLLAEVYSEKMEKPLYRIQAGQLGITPESVQNGLTYTYENAARWGAVVLIDEADVYIRQRDGDMEHNAVVAAMLIALERQTAISFMATNRSNDVDEAITSRCIALVHFEKPNLEDSKKIWRIQAETIGIELSEETIDEIVNHHRNGDVQRASGRDIRALLKLAYRYNRLRGLPVTADLLKQLGAFKRL